MTDNLERRLTAVESTLAETRKMLDDITTQHRLVVETQRDISTDLWGNPARGEAGVKAQLSELREFFTQLQLTLKATKWIAGFLGIGYIVILVRWFGEALHLIQP